MRPASHWPKAPAFALLLLNISYSSAFRLTSMNVPAVADPRGNLELDCRFDMGTEELYAVKWYKDEQEFFRYMPGQDPSIMYFPVIGVSVVRRRSGCDNNYCKIELDKLSRRFSGGAFRCELSSEAPSFKLASETRNVTVAAVPKEKPKIEGLNAHYVEGDVLSANCTSDFGDPPPTLRWFVDGQSTVPVSRPSYAERESDGLMAQSIFLNMVVTNVSKSTLEIGCEASVPGVPFAPQLTAAVVGLMSSQEAGDNEKFQLWYSPFNSGITSPASSYLSCLIFSTILINVLIWT
ncbi:unnamed protein product [Phyllotreta striolata]|uniref:Ig-like domain-containing protein n=1 Tax=Phyllotreta striolata TaxID=444603 RepID=A0A9N9TFK2_PHYSR|nr:unnamed protein product [Phyllotreta striolata]